jgi:hypothetical protein
MGIADYSIEMTREPVSVLSSEGLENALKMRLAGLFATSQNIGLLLSGGIDSALIASFLPRGTPVFTIQFDAEGALDESPAAAAYAKKFELVFTRVTVGWSDYQSLSESLTRRKQAPLHPVEVALHVAARTAKASGIETLIVGNGADSNFGGMDLLLSRDWTAVDFQKRYTFVDPKKVLKESVSQSHVFIDYEQGGVFDTQTFLREIHGYGISMAFQNAILSADVQICTPYEDIRLGTSLDLARIRRGEPKYLLTKLFEDRFGVSRSPKKIAFARPMDQWMGPWSGPRSHCFREDIDLVELDGEQRWLIQALDIYLHQIGAH